MLHDRDSAADRCLTVSEGIVGNPGTAGQQGEARIIHIPFKLSDPNSPPSRWPISGVGDDRLIRIAFAVWLVSGFVSTRTPPSAMAQTPTATNVRTPIGRPELHRWTVGRPVTQVAQANAVVQCCGLLSKYLCTYHFVP